MGRKVRLTADPPGKDDAGREVVLYWEEQESGAARRIRVTVVVGEPYGLMLGYALCDQADAVLRETGGFSRLQVHDHRREDGTTVVCAAYEQTKRTPSAVLRRQSSRRSRFPECAQPERKVFSASSAKG